MTGCQLAASASALVGAPFRLHGRDPATGLDCIGLFGAAMGRAGCPVTLPTGYPLRLCDLSPWLPDCTDYGFAPAERPFRAGDVVMVVPGPAQFHLAIAAAEGGWVHAHAGMRRVIHCDALPDGQLVHHWRLTSPT